MVRQMKQLGISAKLLGGDTLCSPEVAKLWATRSTTCRAYAGMLMDANDTRWAFQDKFKNCFGQTRMRPGLLRPCDVHRRSMQKSGSIDPAKVGDWDAQEPLQGRAG